MSAKSSPDPDARPPAMPAIPDPPNDGFPPDDDISDPPPRSDPKSGAHKKKEN